jgi:hypothetical protein
MRSRYDLYAVINSPELSRLAGMPGTPYCTIYAFLIDPLTSRLKAGLCEFEPHAVSAIEPVACLSVKGDFLVESITEFAEFPMAFNAYPTIEWQRARKDVAIADRWQFFHHIRHFLERHTLLLEPVNDSEI